MKDINLNQSSIGSFLGCAVHSAFVGYCGGNLNAAAATAEQVAVLLFPGKSCTISPILEVWKACSAWAELELWIERNWSHRRNTLHEHATQRNQRHSSMRATIAAQLAGWPFSRLRNRVCAALRVIARGNLPSGNMDRKTVLRTPPSGSDRSLIGTERRVRGTPHGCWWEEDVVVHTSSICLDCVADFFVCPLCWCVCVCA